MEECLGKTPARSTYLSSDELMKKVFFHEPSGFIPDMLLEEDEATAIIFIGDTHIGSKGVAYGQLKADINAISKIKNVKVVLMGDLIDNFIPGVEFR